MKVQEIMSCTVRSASPTDSIASAAVEMAETDIGVLPVVDDGKIVGIVTDRDLTVRGLAGDLHSGSPLMRVMTADVTTCSPDDELADALHAMAIERVRRLPVCRDDFVLVGMLSIGDAARNEEYGAEAVEALAAICHPHGPHSQSRHAA